MLVAGEKRAKAMTLRDQTSRAGDAVETAWLTMSWALRLGWEYLDYLEQPHFEGELLETVRYNK